MVNAGRNRESKMKQPIGFIKVTLMMALAMWVLAGCGQKAPSNANVQFEIPPFPAEKAFAQDKVGALAGGGSEPTAPFAPATVAGFECLMVNVVGEGIGDYSSHVSRMAGGAQFSYIGTYSQMIPTATGGTVSLKVKKGSARKFQIIGVRSTVGCAGTAKASDLSNYTKYPGLFLLGSTTADVSKDDAVELDVSYSLAEALDLRASASSPWPNADTTAPLSSGKTISSTSLGRYSIGLSWPATTDDGTLASQLKYKLVKATSAEALSTVSLADAASAGNTVMDWTANTQVATATSLSAQTTYYFAVLVKDATGNKTKYNVNSFTTSRDTFNLIYYGNSNTSGSVPATTGFLDGTMATVSGNTGTLARTNYRFMGWNTAADGSGTDYSPGQTFTMGDVDISLYAKWTPTYTVTYDANGATSGVAPTDSIKYIDGETVTLKTNSGTLARTHYVFAGWNTLPDGTGLSYTATGTDHLTMGSADVILYALWSPTYTLTYNANGSDGGTVPTDSKRYQNGDLVTVAGNPGSLTRNGHVFVGWNTMANGLGPSYSAVGGDTFSMPGANIVLYAKWAPTYTVTYNANGATSGTVPTDSNKYIESQEVTVRSNTGTLARTGYVFTGWNTAPDGMGDSYSATGAGTLTMPGSDVTLYALWSALRTVTYNSNGATSGTVPVDSATYLNGDLVTIRGNTGNLERTGYTFAGWNTAIDGSGESFSGVGGDAYSMPDWDVTIYAQWNLVPGLTVTYHGNGETGGSVPVDTTTYESDTWVTVLGNSGGLSKSGFAFSGWNTAADGSGTTYQMDDQFTIFGNTDLYAVWTSVPTYTVTYDSNDNTSGSVPTDSNVYISGDIVTTKYNSGDLTQTGSRFVGWNTASDGSGTSYAEGDMFDMPSSNVTLYAEWSAIPADQYYVTYDKNGATGGSVPVDSTFYANGDTVTVLDNIGGLTQSGKSFNGWNTAANGSGTARAADATFNMGTANITLYAQWVTATTYTVTYNANGGSGTTPSSQTGILEGATVTTATGSGLTKTDSVLRGWNTVANGTGDGFALGESFLMVPPASGTTVTLYAQWAPSTKYSVTYDSNSASSGSAPTDSNTYYSGDSVTILSKPVDLTKSGKVFGGWNTAADGAGTTYPEGSTMTMPEENTTLYAVWGTLVYVSDTSGNDTTGNGSSASPYKTISKALSVLGNSGGEIRVDQGTYTITPSVGGTSTLITMKSNVALKGGYQFNAVADWDRDIAAYETIITPSSSSGVYFVYLPNLNGYQVVEGFTFKRNGSASGAVYGVYATGSPSTLIRYNTFKLAAGSSTSVGGIYIAGKTFAEIDGNWIDSLDGGVMAKNIYGIRFASTSTGSSFKVTSNVINTGVLHSTPPYLNAIDMSSANGKITAVVRNNTLRAGGRSSSTTSTYGFGVRKSSNSPRLKLYFDNNIVFGPTGQSGQYIYGVYCYSSSYCSVQSMKNNNFFSLKTVAKLSSSYTSVSSLQNSLTSARGNLSTEMQAAGYFVDYVNKDFHLSNTAPGTITGGGLDGSALGWSFTRDADEVTRTGDGSTGWSMGGFEKD